MDGCPCARGARHLVPQGNASRTRPARLDVGLGFMICCMTLTFSRHAQQRMFERAIGVNAVAQAIRTGETIERQDRSAPRLPVRIINARVDGQALHVVVVDVADGACLVVTVYEPAAAEWVDNFTRRI